MPSGDLFKSIPVSVKNSSGHLQGITVANENWYAYSGGSEIVSSFSNKADRYNGSVTTTSTGATSIGSPSTMKRSVLTPVLPCLLVRLQPLYIRWTIPLLSPTLT